MELETASVRPQTTTSSSSPSSVLLNGSGIQSNDDNNINSSIRGGAIKSTSTKQVSFRGDVPIPSKKEDSTSTYNSNNNNNHHRKSNVTFLSDRSTDSQGSRESNLSRDDSGTSTPSLGSRLMRTQKHRDPLKYYDVLKVLGDGSMGSVSMVKKRRSAVGGSARKSFVDRNKRDKAVEMFPCFSLCFPGSKERKREDSFITLDPSQVDTISGVTGGSGSSGRVSSVSFADGDDNVDQPAQPRRGSKLLRKSSSMISYGSEVSVVYALKSIILDRIMDSTFRKELLNEIDVLRSIDHPNIVKAVETFEYQNRIYLVLELCNGGDLYARDPYTETQAMSITYSLLDAIAYLHSKDITHRDLKYENIMFASPTSPSIKIIDFGLSKKYQPQETMTETVGTVYTMAPEVIKGTYDEKCDVWSVGVIAFMLLSSSLPFYGKTRSHVVRKILQGKYGFKGRRWKTISSNAMAFVDETLVQDPAQRPSATDAMESAWFEKDHSKPGNVLSVHEAVSTAVMDRVIATMKTFGGYSKMKKLALMVIAHKSSDEEIGFLRRLFLQRFDTIKSSANVSYPEFKDALKTYNYSDEELVDLFTGIDIDGTGKVSYTEFLAATIEAHGPIAEERIAEAFDRIDCDDSGFVTVENLRDLLGNDVSKGFLDDIIDEVDNQKVHSVNYDDFLNLWEGDCEGLLRKNLEDVRSRRVARESDAKITPVTPEQSFEEDHTEEEEVVPTNMETSERSSAESSAPGSGGFFFDKEKEKSLRGVWI